MKKPTITIAVMKDATFVFRTVVNKRLIYYSVSVVHDDNNVGTWICRVFHFRSLSQGQVHTFELLSTNRITYPSKSRPLSVAKLMLKRYLRTFQSSDDLPF